MKREPYHLDDEPRPRRSVPSVWLVLKWLALAVACILAIVALNLESHSPELSVIGLACFLVLVARLAQVEQEREERGE